MGFAAKQKGHFEMSDHITESPNASPYTRRPLTDLVHINKELIWQGMSTDYATHFDRFPMDVLSPERWL